VPMCLHGRPVLVGGIGEEIAAAPVLPRFALLLVNPRVPLPTPDVFRGRSGAFSPPGRFEHSPADALALAALLAARGNDLTAAAAALVPEVAAVLEALARAPGVLLARMSGSGATCFGLCADAETAQVAARSLAAEYPGWWITAGSAED
jgi:4-diphosphocytidyl-2-C-methyl-D-erythritol kinase